MQNPFQLRVITEEEQARRADEFGFDLRLMSPETCPMGYECDNAVDCFRASTPKFGHPLKAFARYANQLEGTSIGVAITEVGSATAFMANVVCEGPNRFPDDGLSRTLQEFYELAIPADDSSTPRDLTSICPDR